MPSNSYKFLTRWRVEGPREAVYRLLEDTPGYVRWWPAVWLKVEELAATLRRLHDSPEERARVGEAGLARVQERYAWPAVAQATVEHYRAAITHNDRQHRMSERRATEGATDESAAPEPVSVES